MLDGKLGAYKPPYFSYTSRCVQAEKIAMKIKLITIILIFTTISSFGQSVSKSELEKIVENQLHSGKASAQHRI